MIEPEQNLRGSRSEIFNRYYSKYYWIEKVLSRYMRNLIRHIEQGTFKDTVTAKNLPIFGIFKNDLARYVEKELIKPLYKIKWGYLDKIKDIIENTFERSIPEENECCGRLNDWDTIFYYKNGKKFYFTTKRQIFKIDYMMLNTLWSLRRLMDEAIRPPSKNSIKETLKEILLYELKQKDPKRKRLSPKRYRSIEITAKKMIKQYHKENIFS